MLSQFCGEETLTSSFDFRCSFPFPQPRAVGHLMARGGCARQAPSAIFFDFFNYGRKTNVSGEPRLPGFSVSLLGRFEEALFLAWLTNGRPHQSRLCRLAHVGDDIAKPSAAARNEDANSRRGTAPVYRLDFFLADRPRHGATTPALILASSVSIAPGCDENTELRCSQT